MNGWTDDVDQANRDQVNAELERLRAVEAAARALVEEYDRLRLVTTPRAAERWAQLRFVLEGRASSSPPTTGGGDPPRG